MSLAAVHVAAYGKGMDQKSINELCTVFHALSHGVGRELSSLQEYSVLASPPSPCSRPCCEWKRDRQAVAAHARVSATRLRQTHAVRQDKSGATVATCNHRKRTAVKSARDGDAGGTRADETRGQRHVRTTHAATDTPGACAPTT